MTRRTQRGFTLYELLVTVLVAGVIFGLGVPNLLEFSRNNRMAGVANDLLGALMLARNTAFSRHLPVTLCASPEPVIDDPECDDDLSDADTAGGYFVWVDEDGDAVRDAGEQILLQRDDPENLVVLAASGFVTFDNRGYVQNPAASANAVLFCDPRGNTVASGTLSAARAVRIDPTGRAQVLREIAEITTLDAAAFGNLACP